MRGGRQPRAHWEQVAREMSGARAKPSAARLWIVLLGRAACISCHFVARPSTESPSQARLLSAATELLPCSSASLRNRGSRQVQPSAACRPWSACTLGLPQHTCCSTAAPGSGAAHLLGGIQGNACLWAPGAVVPEQQQLDFEGAQEGQRQLQGVCACTHRCCSGTATERGESAASQPSSTKAAASLARPRQCSPPAGCARSASAIVSSWSPVSWKGAEWRSPSLNPSGQGCPGQAWPGWLAPSPPRPWRVAHSQSARLCKLFKRSLNECRADLHACSLQTCVSLVVSAPRCLAASSKMAGSCQGRPCASSSQCLCTTYTGP